ncbi:MAG: outer membrane protein assembly factor BamB family protein [Methanobacteriota archaeon]
MPLPRADAVFFVAVFVLAIQPAGPFAAAAVPTGPFEAESFPTRTAGGAQSSGLASGGAYWNLWSNGYIEDTFDGDARSNLTIVARGSPLSGVWPTMVVSVDGTAVRTFTVATNTLQTYSGPPMTIGTHAVRISFTNDARSSTEDRNLYLDVVRSAGSADPGAPPSGSFTLAPGETRNFTFPWTGGAGHLLAHAATLPTNNTRPRLLVAIDGAPVGAFDVAGPVPRPALASFVAPNGTRSATLTATGGWLVLEDVRATTALPPPSASGVEARVHVGGVADGTAWRFDDFGLLEAPLVVPTTGWYDLRVRGTGVVSTVGPLVHLLLNRTVVAERVEGAAVDLAAPVFLVGGVGYSMGASFENPGAGRSLRVESVSATARAGPPLDLPPAVTVSPSNDPAGWPQYGRDSYNSCATDDASVPGRATVGSLALRWRTRLDGSVTSTPAVANGRVYVGTWANSVYALNETTGEVVWRATLSDRVDSSPSVAGGLVLVGAGPAVVALDEGTGTEIWRTLFAGHMWSSPIVEGDDVFVGISADRGHVARLSLSNGSVVALDRETGALVWSHQFFPLDTNDESTPEATIRENRDFGATPHLVLRNGRPVVLASEKHGPVWAVDLADGRLVHGSRLLEQRVALIGSGGASDGVEVVTGSEPDRVAAFDIATGDLLWEQPMPSTTFAPVAIGNGVVWVGSWSGGLRAFDLHTGRLLVALDAGGGVFGGASLAEGRVFVGSLEYPPAGGFAASLGVLPGYVSAWG